MSCGLEREILCFFPVRSHQQKTLIIIRPVVTKTIITPIIVIITNCITQTITQENSVLLCPLNFVSTLFWSALVCFIEPMGLFCPALLCSVLPAELCVYSLLFCSRLLYMGLFCPVLPCRLSFVSNLCCTVHFGFMWFHHRYVFRCLLCFALKYSALFFSALCCCNLLCCFGVLFCSVLLSCSTLLCSLLCSVLVCFGLLWFVLLYFVLCCSILFCSASF